MPMKQTILLQRYEGAVVLAGSVWLYHQGDGNLLIFAVVLLLPDLTMLGYLAGPRVGALVYNLGHSYVIPGLLALAFLATTQSVPPLLYIWFAHIGMDRLFGYGLKEDTGFRHTHLGLIGKQ
jgi:hypothetical protein